ncbi:hypothetical protein [Micromonospora sp. NPDC048898]|uniref:hypothetical protein n=1 Tax=Micromonospora sp. NPDC048898 TaxID=3364260 RepID=UPI0037132156
MSETGQPGAATPGEHGDGAGQHDDPGRPVSGWAPPAGGWPRAADREDARDEAPRWQPDPASGWRTSSSRHGDLPSPLVGQPGDLAPPARANGHHANGVHHPDDANGVRHPTDANGVRHPTDANGVRHPTDANGVRHPGLEPSAGHPTPVSAPPGLPADGRPEVPGDRLVVPAQRPAPALEQGAGEPDTGSATRSTVDPATHRARWAEPGLPTSAPPAVQVPPVGTAASGFEVPPGFRAPTTERLTADDPAAPRDWRDPLPPEPAPAPGRTAGHADATDPGRAGDSSRPADTQRAGESPTIEPDWSGPNWNRPSSGGGWAPPWSRQDDEPAAAAARDESTPGWVAEPHQPYEPVRAEPPRPYEPVRADPPRGYDPVRGESGSDATPLHPTKPISSPPSDRPSWVAPAAVPPADPSPTSGPPVSSAGMTPPVAERPSWASGPTPTSGPPADRPSWAGSEATGAPRADRPSWAGGSDPGPTGVPPVRPSWAGESDPASTPARPSWAAGSEAATNTPSVRPSWAGGSDPEPASAPPARPSWAGASDPTPTGVPPARPSWAGGSEAATNTPSVRPSWAGGSDPEPSGAPPARSSWAGGSDPEPAGAPPARSSWAVGSDPTPTSVPPVLPSWAGGPDPTPTSAPPTRPSWVSGAAPADPPPPAPAGSTPTLSDAPPAPAGPPPLVAERPSWVGGSSTASGPRAERPDWSEGRIPAAPPERQSWPASQSTGTGGGAAGEPSGLPRPEIRPAAPFRLRPATPEPPVEPPRSTAPSSAAAASSPTAAVPPSALGGSGRRDRPAGASTSPYAARRSAPDPTPSTEPADDGRQPDPRAAVLPQRVPAEPDVPVVPEPPAVEPPAETPELARIATHLRRDDEPAPLRERPEGFDVNAILDAVREVAGVRDAALRRTPAGAHSLRLDLADGADPAEVSRQVARLLQERMGLAAAPQNVPGLPTTPPPPVRRRLAEPRPAERRTAEPLGAAPRDAGPDPRAADVRATEPTAPAHPSGASVEATPAGSEQSTGTDTTRRRRPNAPHRGRATVEEPGSVAAPAGAATGSPATLGTSYSGGQVTTTESAPSRPLDTGGTPGPRVVIDHVQVSTFGLDANVEVRLLADGDSASGYATGPAVDGYVLRLCAVAAAAAVDELLRDADNAERGRCFVEHAAVVPFGNCEVATVVVLLVCAGWVEQLAGSALVAGDPRQAVVRATLAAVNRRLEALLS